MSIGLESQFACEMCGKQYPWKQQYAGRKVKCACGHVMTAPEAPTPPAQPQEEADLYDIADDHKPVAPPKPTRSAVAPVAAAAAGTTSSTLRPPPVSPMLAYQQTIKKRDTSSDFDNAIGGKPWRELYLPAALVLLGLFLNCLLAMHESGKWVSLNSVLPMIGLTLLFNLILSFAGILMVARWFEIGFGHPGTAILKMSACILLPIAIAGFAGEFIGHDSGFVNMMVRATLMFPLTICAVMLLFELDINESVWCVVVIYVITDWVTKLLVIAILSGVVSPGASSAITGGGGQAAQQGPTPSEQAEKLAKDPQVTDAQTWIVKGQRVLGQMSPAQSRKLVQDFLTAGALDVKISYPYAYHGYNLLVHLPEDATKRQNVIKVYEALMTQLGDMAEKIVKEDKYLYIEFGQGMEDPTQPVADP